MQQRILVTGSSGFIGFHAVEHLIELGHRVICYDVSPGQGSLPSSVERIQGDMADFDRLCQLVCDVTGIIHLAGVSRLGEGYAEPRKCMLTNTGGTLNILEAMRISPARPWAILGSTREVQDTRLHGDTVFFQNAKGVYGLSKLCSELLSERYALDYKLRVLSLRFSDVYGSPFDNLERVLPKLMLRALRGEDLFVVDSPNRHDFTYYTDTVGGIAKAVEFLAEKESSFYDVATICTGKGTSIKDLAALIVQRSGSHSRLVVHDPSSADAFRSSPLSNDTSRAKDMFGFEAQIPLEMGIERTVQSFRGRA